MVVSPPSEVIHSEDIPARRFGGFGTREQERRISDLQASGVEHTDSIAVDVGDDRDRRIGRERRASIVVEDGRRREGVCQVVKAGRYVVVQVFQLIVDRSRTLERSVVDTRCNLIAIVSVG